MRTTTTTRRRRLFLWPSAREMRRIPVGRREGVPPPPPSSSPAPCRRSRRTMLLTKSDLRVVFVLLAAAQMSGTVFAEIHATVESFSVVALNATSCRVCWTHPLLAPFNKYELFVLNEAKLSRVVSVRINRNARRQCHQLTDLKSSSNYMVTIRTLTPTKGQSVIFAEVNFTTPSDACSPNPCLAGSICVPSSLDPGYECRCAGQADDCTRSTCPKCDTHGHVTTEEIRCDCDEADSGCAEECRPQNDAPEVECQHGGTAVTEAGRRRCACARRYFGVRCEHVRSCVGSLRCQNGGVCVVGEETEERCECRRGFIGDQCDSVDRCVPGPCQNGGYCRNLASSSTTAAADGGGDYHCFCYDGFYGRNCTSYDPCSSSPCQNNGICRNVTDADYVCRCRPGFHGDNCELYSPCADNPCLHNGMCNSIDGQFFCDCEQGRYGRRCEYVDLCRHLRPCGSNSVACHNMSNTSYKCICEPGWSGENCTFHNPCYNSPCLNDGACLPLRSTVDGFLCECSDGFWGSVCEMVNPCFGSPCINGGTCLNTSTTAYVCRCPLWFSGEHCEYASACAWSKCGNEAHCINVSQTEYSCACRPGNFGQYCQFFNICSENPCKPGKCQLESPVGDRYACTCPPGYSGSNCQHYNPCSSSPCRNGGLCTGQADGTFHCKCPNGTFYGPLCDYVDACASSPCQRGGSCVNDPPMNFRCICPPAVFGDVCESRDACVARPCRNGGTCVTLRQMEPEYVCQCTYGYYGSSCEFVDPCRLDPCLHGGTCARGGGRQGGREEGGSDGFVCHCDIEFQGRQCEDEIPCNSHGKKCYNGGVCDRQPNGTVFCRCPTGYYGFRCQNFDPCSRNNTCDNGGTCQVIDNGLLHQCLCQSGFFGEHCELHRPCDVYVCRNSGTCVRTIQMDICYCGPGFTGGTCEVDLNECESLPCQNGGSCVDLPGRYFCECPEGYAGDACQLEDVCPRDEVLTPKGVFVWPATTRDSQTSLECPRNPGSYAVRSCRQHPSGATRSRWDAADLSKCSMSVQSSRGARNALGPYRSQNLTDEQIVSDVVSLLSAVLQFAFEDSQVALYMLEIVDRILSVPEAIIRASNTTDRILHVLEKFVENVKLAKSNMTFVGSNLQIVVRFTSWVDHETGTVFVPQKSPDIRLFLPAEIFHKDISSDRVKFVYLRNSKLFRSAYSLQSVHDVISANVGSDQMVGLKTCVRYVMPNRQLSKHNRCVYWSSNENVWSSDGIETLSYRGRRTVCCSDRLTYFGITSDPEVAAVSFVKEDFEAMIATNCGLGLAIACLGVVLLTYVLCRPFNGQEFGQLVIHLTSSMLATNICLLIGYNRFKVDSSNTCAVIAILTHFFTLSTQLWLIIVAYHILRESSNDYMYQENVFLCKRFAFAWGLPLFPVAISVTVDLDEYRQNPESCVLTGENHYVYCSTYLLPMCITYLGGFIIWVAICRSFCPAVFNCGGKSRLSVNQVLGSLMVTLLADLSWAVYFVSTLRAFSEESAYLRYSYCVMQAATGLAVVFAYLVLRTDTLVTCRQLTCLQKRRSPEKESGTMTAAAAGVMASSEDHAPARTIQSNASVTSLSRTDPVVQRMREKEGAFHAHSEVVSNSSISRNIDPDGGVRPSPRQTTSAGSHYRTTKYEVVITDRRLAGQPLNHVSTSLPSRSAGCGTSKSQKACSRSAVSSLESSSDEVLVHTSV